MRHRVSLLCLLALLIAGCAGENPVPPGEALTVGAPRLLLPPPGADNAAAYMELRNQGADALTLERYASPHYERVELHDMVHGDDGMMRMRRIESLRIEPGESVSLAPHGRHLMLMAPRERPQAGESVALRITYLIGEERHDLELALPAEAR